MTEMNKQQAVQNRLLPWFAKHARDLPWRKKRTPYRVWVSEIMLQQTRVDTVIDYYNRWMKKFPSWRSLARASQDDVLKMWEGLGYYSRARNLHAAAKIISGEYGGNLSNHWKKSFQPSEKSGENIPAIGKNKVSRAKAQRPPGVPEPCGVRPLHVLQTMPGVGPYTAAAIASLAFGEDTAVVDGNVSRVLSRLFAYDGDVKSAAGKKQMQARADGLLVPGRAGEFNEAMMELGALVCLPVAPKCADCPLQAVCAAFKSGDPERWPVMKKKKKVPHLTVGAAVIMNRRGQVLIAQRLDGDMLGGLWEFPGGKQEPGETIEECIARELKEELGINTGIGDFLMTVKHSYSHFKMTMHVYFAKIRSARPRPIHCAGFCWADIPDLGKFAYSKADLQVVARLQQGKPGA
jgi:A/G-specific adenine glycosylase